MSQSHTGGKAVKQYKKNKGLSQAKSEKKSSDPNHAKNREGGTAIPVNLREKWLIFVDNYQLSIAN